MANPSPSRVAARHIKSRGFYDDIAALVDDAIREKVFDLTDAIEEDARDAERRVRSIKNAWSNRDMKELEKEGVIGQKEMTLLSRIYAAQQSGDERLMYRLVKSL